MAFQSAENRKRAEYGFKEYGSNTELSEFFGPHRVPGRELSTEFLSAYYLCAKADSPSFFFSQNSPSLP